MAGELGFDPYARIIAKISGACVFGAGVVAVIAGEFLAADDRAKGSVLEIAGFVSLMIGVHLWFGKRDAWLGYLVDAICGVYIGLVCVEWLGWWGFVPVILSIIAAAGYALYRSRDSVSYDDDLDDEWGWK